MSLFVSSPKRTANPTRGVPALIYPVAAILFLFFGIGQNAILSLFSFLILVAGTSLLWRPGEPPILLIIFLYQWVQSSFALFYCNWLDLEINNFSILGGDIELATILSLAGVMFLGIGIRFGVGRPNAAITEEARRIVMGHSTQTWFRLFISVWIFSNICRALISMVPGLSQLLLGFAVMKWAGFVMFTYVTFSRRDGNRILWLMVFFIEFASSLGGFFAFFKEVFIYTFIGIIAANVRFKPATILIILATFAAMLYCALIWQAVKVDYRFYANGGEATQAVVGNIGERLSKLGELVSNVETKDMTAAMDSLIRRLMYTEYFGVVLHVVPDLVPHEYGALWFDSLTRPLTPRVLFPDKAIIDESVLTNKYTGLAVSGFDRGTQISIGYMGETYIDFGISGMMLFIAAWGFVLGRVYRWLTTDSRLRGIIGLSMTAPVLWPVAYLESSSAKIVGGLASTLVASWLVAKFVSPKFMLWARSSANRRTICG